MDSSNAVLGVFLAIVIALILALVGAWIGVALWSAIMVKIFGLPDLTFWQFYGLIILIHILFPSNRIFQKKED